MNIYSSMDNFLVHSVVTGAVGGSVGGSVVGSTVVGSDRNVEPDLINVKIMTTFRFLFPIDCDFSYSSFPMFNSTVVCSLFVSVTCLQFHELGLSVSVACMLFFENAVVSVCYVSAFFFKWHCLCLRYEIIPMSVSVACLRSKKYSCRCMRL